MNNCITTYSKIKFNVMEPDAEDIRIEDIAHALSMMARANGHFPEFFSVAQHSLQCVREALARHYVPALCMACLLHDASEAYLSDIVRPVKHNMTMYLQIEEQLQDSIYKKYIGYVPHGEEAVLIKNIDDACLYYEFEHFMGERIYPMKPVMMSCPDYSVQDMNDVEEEFLDVFRELLQKMEEQETVA